MEIYIAKALEGRLLAPFADRLGLTSLTLQSRLVNLHESERSKRDTVVALIAARFLSQWTRWSPFECIPRPIQEWIAAVPATAARTFDLKSPVAVLQELAQMFGLRVDYAPCLSVGAQHQATLLASLTLSPVNPQAERLAVEIRGGSGRSSNDARQSLAAKVIALLRAIHSDVKLAGTLVDQATMTATAKLVLGTAASCAPTHASSALRWQIEGLLGTGHLRASDEQSFRAWLTEALPFIRTTHGPQFSNIVRQLIDFYSQYARSHGADLKSQCLTVLAEIEEPMTGSDPIARAIAIKESPAFRRRGTLLRVLSVSSKPRNTVATLGHELESLSVLNRSEAHVNAASGGDVSWTEREGSMLELIREIMKLSRLGLDRLIQDVRGSLHDGRVIVRFPAVTQDDALQIESGLEQSVVFQFLRADDFVGRVFCKDGLVVELSTGGETHNFSAEYICRAIANPLSTFPPQERAVANRLLHDLKNHLISASVASKSPQTDRTSGLRAQHEASAHLDAAKRLCEAFRAVSGSSDEVHLEDLSLREFFRGFCSRTLLELPAHVALRPPTNVDEGGFTTSSQLLTSIVDNLVRNAVEALDQPRLVSIEWTLTEDSALSIEVSDNGRGMPQDKLRKLICGEATNSDKAGGSGIGMFTVVSMLRRLGGTILGTSEIGFGTRWEVRLPDMRRMEYEPPIDATADVAVRSVNG